jgi:NAD(P)-dependent dehydrogenase (short-subunit alcohol dehydrogenase family)
MTVETDLSGRVAVVTGASRGLGQEISEILAEAGADIVAAARTEEEIEETVETVEREYGVDGVAVPTDLRDDEDIEALIPAAEAELGTPQILVNNAGLNFANRVLDQTTDEVDAMTDVNFRATFLLSQQFGTAIRDADVDGGSIVNISSISGYVGKDFTSVYGGTKAGIYGLTRGLAAGLSKHDVRVNSITPSTTRVERVEKRIEEWGEEMYDTEKIPLGRLGEPEDVADAALFLASDRSSYITGTDILVDGGIQFTAGMYPHD